MSLFSKYFIWSLYLSCHVISCHVILCCAVVYNFILLGLYLNMKLSAFFKSTYEEKLFKSALATKSLQLTIFFSGEIFYTVRERRKKRNCSPHARFFNSLSSLFLISAAFRADSESLWTGWCKKSIWNNENSILRQGTATRHSYSFSWNVPNPTPPVPCCCTFTHLARSENKYDQHLLKNKEPAILRCITSGINATSLEETIIYLTGTRIIFPLDTTRKISNTVAMVSLVETIFLVAWLRLRCHEDSL